MRGRGPRRYRGGRLRERCTHQVARLGEARVQARHADLDTVDPLPLLAHTRLHLVESRIDLHLLLGEEVLGPLNCGTPRAEDRQGGHENPEPRLVRHGSPSNGKKPTAESPVHQSFCTSRPGTSARDRSVPCTGRPNARL